MLAILSHVSIIAVKKCLVIIMSFLTKPRYQHQQRYRLLTKITWSPFSFGPNILIRSSLLREVLVEQAPHPHSNQLFLGGKKPKYSAPHPPVLPSIHTPAGWWDKTWSVPNKQPLLFTHTSPAPSSALQSSALRSGAYPYPSHPLVALSLYIQKHT